MKSVELPKRMFITINRAISLHESIDMFLTPTDTMVTADNIGWDLVNENKEVLPESEEFTKAVADLIKARNTILVTLEKYK